MLLHIKRWLPIVFGCHCKKERSFYFHGEPFPICARCSGELIGILLGMFSFPFYHPTPWIAIWLMIPMLLDGFAQALTRYKSVNGLRFITGILFGYALIVLFASSVVAMYQYGRSYGIMLMKK